MERYKTIWEKMTIEQLVECYVEHKDDECHLICNSIINELHRREGNATKEENK